MKIVKSKVELIEDKSDLEECHKDIYLYDTYKNAAEYLKTIGHRYIDVCGAVIEKNAKTKEVFVTTSKSQLLKESDIRYSIPYDSRFKKRLTVKITSSKANIDVISNVFLLLGLDSITRFKDEDIVNKSIEEPEFVFEMDESENPGFFRKNYNIFKSREQEFLTRLVNNSYTDYDDLLGIIPSIKDQIIITANKDLIREFIIRHEIIPKNIRILIQQQLIKLESDEIRKTVNKFS